MPSPRIVIQAISWCLKVWSMTKSVETICISVPHSKFWDRLVPLIRLVIYALQRKRLSLELSECQLLGTSILYGVFVSHRIQPTAKSRAGIILVDDCSKLLSTYLRITRKCKVWLLRDGKPYRWLEDVVQLIKTLTVFIAYLRSCMKWAFRRSRISIRQTNSSLGS